MPVPVRSPGSGTAPVVVEMGGQAVLLRVAAVRPHQLGGLVTRFQRTGTKGLAFPRSRDDAGAGHAGIKPVRTPVRGMNPTEVERLIRETLPDARVEVTRARGEHDDDHLAALVVSPAFEGETLVAQHDRVYDALDGHVTTDIHALELSTYTPEAFAESDAAFAEDR